MTSPDLTSSADTGISNTDNTTSDTAPTFTLACETDGTTMTLYVEGIADGTTALCASGTATLTVSDALTDGSYDITYTESNIHGESAASPALTVMVDTIDPAAPTINPVLAGATSIDGTGENDTTITLTGITCDNAPVIIAGGVWECTQPQPVPLSADVLNAYATDTAGNASAAGMYTIPAAEEEPEVSGG